MTRVLLQEDRVRHMARSDVRVGLMARPDVRVDQRARIDVRHVRVGLIYLGW